ncbi:MAG: hypothetical protein Q4F06_01570 [Eubacteriales bacterium]|nr:hypothetical protein [Eubacteriales bacterium]
MYSYFLSDYIYTISGKDKRKFKDLTKGEIAQLLALIIFSVFVFITTIVYQLMKTTGSLFFELIAIMSLYIVMGVIIILDNKKWKRNNIDYLKEYENNHINEYIKRLELLNMYSEKDILWLIEQSKKYYHNEGEKSKAGKIGSSLIFPIIIGYISIITNKSDIVTATYIIIILLAILSIFLVMYYCIAPMIYKIINKRKYIARDYENDLSYILLKLER